MSIHGKMGSFLNAANLMVALNEEDLDLPVDPPMKEQVGIQRYRFAPNTIVAFYNKAKTKLGYFQAISHDKHGGKGWKWTFQSTLGGGRIFVSHWQISVLEQQGRIRPLEDGKERTEAKRPADIISVSPEKEKEALRKRDYCLALIKAEDGGNVRLTRKVVDRVALEVSIRLGEQKPPCYGSLTLWLKRYKSQPWNRLLALVTNTSKGNRSIRPVTYHLEALIADCVKETWEDPDGKGTHVLARLEAVLLEPENASVLKAITQKDGTVQLPDSRTLERRFYAINLYIRDLWRFDEETAARNHAFYTGRALPDHALGIVEVDYTVGDISVYDDNLPILFGRPHVILFRDKKTGSILGFGVHFENPSYHTFLATLRQAIYPKDMSEYPGLRWVQYGQPRIRFQGCSRSKSQRRRHTER